MFSLFCIQLYQVAHILKHFNVFKSTILVTLYVHRLRCSTWSRTLKRRHIVKHSILTIQQHAYVLADTFRNCFSSVSVASCLRIKLLTDYTFKKWLGITSMFPTYRRQKVLNVIRENFYCLRLRCILNIILKTLIKPTEEGSQHLVMFLGIGTGYNSPPTNQHWPVDAQHHRYSQFTVSSLEESKPEHQSISLCHA